MNYSSCKYFLFLKISLMRVYFLGIGGTAMGNAAILLKKLGHFVSGSDSKIYPPMSKALDDSDIKCYLGYDSSRLESLFPDIVVVGNSISRGNSEIEWLLNENKILFISLPQLIRQYFLSKKECIVITGTHGKTTTASIAAHLLIQNECSPSWFIGGVPMGLESGAHIGEGKDFIIEGDEYDTSFFDKRSKFIHYTPNIVSINNLEMDHSDIFRDLEDIKRSFSHLIRIIPERGFLITNGDDPNIKEVTKNIWCSQLTVGLNSNNDLVIDDFNENSDGSTFKLFFKGTLWAEISWSLPGIYNARNAAVAALSAGISFNKLNPDTLDLSSLSQFKGVRRRQEKLYESKDYIVIEDFAHHPTAIKEIVESKRNVYPKHHIIVCFEPRSNTSRSNLFQEAFIDVLALSDAILIGLFNLDRNEIGLGDEKLNRKYIVKKLRLLGKEADCFECNQHLLEHLILSLESKVSNRLPKLILFFSNGSFDGIMSKFVNHLAGIKK